MPDNPIQSKHEASSSAGADVEKALLKNLQECLRAMLQMDPSLAQRDFASGDTLRVAETSIKTIPHMVLSRYFNLLDRPVLWDMHKLIELADQHPKLLMEVSPQYKRTFLHVAVIANSEVQVQKLLDMMLVDKDTAFSNSNIDHMSKKLEYLLTIESLSGFTAYQMACIYGNDRIVRRIGGESGEDVERMIGPKLEKAEDANGGGGGELEEEPGEVMEGAGEVMEEAETPKEEATKIAETPKEEATKKADTPKDANEEAETLTEAERREVQIIQIGEVLKFCLEPLGFSNVSLKIMSLGDEFRLHTSLKMEDYNTHRSWIRYSRSYDIAEFLRDIISKLAEQGLFSTFLELRDNAGRHILHYLADLSLGGISSRVLSGSREDESVLDLIFTTLMCELNLHVAKLDMNVRDSVGRTPLHLAAAQGFVKRVAIFANDVRTDLNATFNMSSCGVDRQGEEDWDFENISALSLATTHNHFEVVRSLLNAPTSRKFQPLNVNLRISKEFRRLGPYKNIVQLHWSPLQLAAFKGHVETLEVLLADDRVHDFESNGQKGFLNYARSLHLATLGGKPHAVKALLKNNKVDPFSLDSHGNTALYYALIVQFTEDVYGPWAFMNIRHCFRLSSCKRRKLKNSGEIIGCIDLLLQAGLDMDQPNKHGRAIHIGAHFPHDVQQWWYDKVARELQVKKNNINAATNAISVTAALVAATSFVGPLQPPLGLSTNTDAENMWLLGYSQVNHVAVDIFLFFDSLSFYFAIASIMLALIPSLPIQHEGIFREEKRAQHYLQGAVVLLFASITFLICTFSAASVVIIPKGRWNYKAIIISTTIFGGFICFVVLILFLKRLWRLIRPKRFRRLNRQHS